MTTLIALAIIGLLVLGLVTTSINAYNRLVMLKFNVDKAFANIDVLLKQRADEIPNLIAVVKENMKYEEGVLNKLTQLRTNFLNTSSANEKIEISNEIEKTVKSIFAVSENYPDLKSNNNFVMLQQRVSEIENAIADRREFFNESVNAYNIGTHVFPEVIFARLMGYQDKTLLRITEYEKKYDGVKF
ncbi:MAG: LemA family protein [Flavobacteriaceae bacterium]